MSRRRYLSTDISTDARFNKLMREGGDFAGLLYCLMIPHADDYGGLSSDPEELLYTVLPGRRDKNPEEVERALDKICELNLMIREDGHILFPADTFYRYQTYIPADKRRIAKNAAERRGTAKNASSLSPSPPLSLSKKPPAARVNNKSESESRGKLKVAIAGLMNSDPNRFRRLPEWVRKQRGLDHLDDDIASALIELKKREEKMGPVKDFWGYLEGRNGSGQSAVERARTERLQAEASTYKKPGPVKLGDLADLAKLATMGAK